MWVSQRLVLAKTDFKGEVIKQYVGKNTDGEGKKQRLVRKQPLAGREKSLRRRKERRGAGDRQIAIV